MHRARTKSPSRLLVLAAVAIVYLVFQWFQEGQVRIGETVLWPSSGAVGERGEAATRSGVVERLFAQERSDVVVEVSGEVSRVLIDDNKGSRHQRFILELPSGHTVLVAHNIDLAPRAPLSRGDRVEVKGEYEWNDRGGVLHWTHRDPRGRHEGGWIRHQGEIYQ